MKCGVYLLKFDSGRTYLGSTNDLDRRIIQHSQGLVRSTAKLGKFLGVLAFQETSCLPKPETLNEHINLGKIHPKSSLLSSGRAAPTPVGVDPSFES